MPWDPAEIERPAWSGVQLGWSSLLSVVRSGAAPRPMRCLTVPTRVVDGNTGVGEQKLARKLALGAWTAGLPG